LDHIQFAKVLLAPFNGAFAEHVAPKSFDSLVQESFSEARLLSSLFKVWDGEDLDRGVSAISLELIKHVVHVVKAKLGVFLGEVTQLGSLLPYACLHAEEVVLVRGVHNQSLAIGHKAAVPDEVDRVVVLDEGLEVFVFVEVYLPYELESGS